MKSELGRRLGKVAATGAGLAMAFAVGADLAPRNSADAHSVVSETTGTPDRTLTCKRQDAWYPLHKGETVRLRTRGAVAVADITVSGVFQSDTDENTATEVAFKSVDKNKKSWTVGVDFEGSVDVLACDVTGKRLDQVAGTLNRTTDVKNDPIKRVNSNWLIK